MARTRKGEQTVKKLFGGSLYQQGRGFYVSLELFAIIKGSMMLGHDRVLKSGQDEVEYIRRSHDFARRLAYGSAVGSATQALRGERADATLQELLKGLKVPIPGVRTAASDWRKIHFYPYVGDLVHHDALERAGRIQFEMDSYRGGGALVHKLLRTDDDEARLAETRLGFIDLLADSDGPLGKLMRALSSLDERPPDPLESPFQGRAEEASRVESSDWVELLRSGVSRILARREMPRARKVEALMHWVPYCVARHQLELSYRCLERSTGSLIPVDCMSVNSVIREKSRETLNQSTNAIYKALEKAASDEGATELMQGSQNWRTGPRTFFSTTLFTVGGISSLTGIRYFVLGPELLDAIILAMTEREFTFEEFCRRILCERMGLVVDKQSAARAPALKDIDNERFDQNAECLADSLREMGALREYSDSTRMVGVQI